jgi:hypothetical protein
VPGIDYGTVYHLGTAFVVWSDAPGGGGGSTSSSEEGVKCQVSLLARDGRRVEFHCNTKDGKTGPVGVNGIGYDLADGNLFLVRTEGDQCRVKQLRRDVSQWTFEPDNLRAIGPSESAIAQFFSSPVQPKQVDPLRGTAADRGVSPPGRGSGFPGCHSTSPGPSCWQ